MRSEPGIQTFSNASSGSVACTGCGAPVLILGPDDGVYPLGSPARVQGHTQLRRGACTCGQTFAIPVTTAGAQ